MDELKYIPGDLVMTKTEPNDFIPNGIVCKFNEYVFKDKVYVSAVMLADNFICKKEDIAPIPLTPEILEKNGWKDDGSDWYRLPTKRAYLYITKDIKTLSEFLVCVGLDRHNLASINFVHQLQHLLFGLNINSEIEV